MSDDKKGRSAKKFASCTLGHLALVALAVGSTGSGAAGCVDKPAPFHPFTPDDGGAGDGDADADGDSDADADVDADGGPEPGEDECRADGDCELAVDVDECCACPRAVTITRERIDQCLVEYPIQPGTVPVACVVDCEACNQPACPEPTGAVCRSGSCVPVFPGECLVDADCSPGSTCELLDGELVCVNSGGCSSDDDCFVGEWCSADGACELLEDGQCVRSEDCGDMPCVRPDPSAPGTCDEAPCEDRSCPQGFVCLEVLGATRCMRECHDGIQCGPTEDCVAPAIGAVPECVDVDCSRPQGCDAPEMFCDDLDADGLNECVLYGECVYDGHCPRGEDCLTDDATGGNVCAARDDRCALPEDCGVDMACVDVDGDGFLDCQSAVGDCLLDQDCGGARRVCRDFDHDGYSECGQSGQCTRTTDCSEGEYCIRFNDQGRGQCVEPGAQHCIGSVDCGAAEICFDVNDDGIAECVSDGSHQ